MIRQLANTSNSFALLIVRITLAIVIFPHGAQKVLGWFGGDGFMATLEGMSTGMGIPKILIVLVMLAEFLGSLFLFFGFLGRIMAFSIMCVMLGATFIVHVPNGFFMNWSGNQAGEGFEFHLLAIGIALAIIVGGSGMFSVDRVIGQDRKPRY